MREDGVAIAMTEAENAVGAATVDETLITGTVKWFDPVRGYGFMVPS
ncbi:MAG: Cold-shock DNA-binding domain, partial [Pseudomonadota bacterium]